MKRRNFIIDSALVAFSTGAFGKIKWNGTAYVGENATTTDILGPFYRPGAPFVTNLVRPGTKGELLHFGGTVYAGDGKSPVKDALVEIWHCNEEGVYDNTSDEYIYRAAWKTGADGKYYFKTILPVAYNAGPNNIRPAHIHMRISGTPQQDLVTQVYFKGDEHIAKDMSASDPRSLNRILSIAHNEKKEKEIRFDIVLQDEYVLEKAAFKKITGLYEMSDKSLCEFYRQGDQLFAKVNGQIIEAMDYKGNNSFESGLGQTKAQFELLANGGSRVKVSYVNDDRTYTNITGNEILKYPPEKPVAWEDID